MTSMILPMLSTRSPRLLMMVAEEPMEPLMRLRPSVVFCMVPMPLLHLVARAAGDIQQHLGGVGHALNAGDHLIDGGRGFADAGGLHLGVLHHVLHVDAHLVHGAGDFVDGRGRLHVDLGGVLGGVGHLVGTGGHLRGGIAHRAHQGAQAVGHLGEGGVQGVAVGAGRDLDGEIAAGDGFGDRRHLPEVDDHVAQGLREGSDLIGALDVDLLVEIALVADLAGHVDDVLERLR